ncbi:hypothetical protein [Flavobacterium acetivorans]|nr:hypothetical protein [Flavobacterium sp. F-29]UFH36555.1 hypothetical protein LNP19_05805 [Flavobacterium sp. F-29]
MKSKIISSVRFAGSGHEYQKGIIKHEIANNKKFAQANTNKLKGDTIYDL